MNYESGPSGSSVASQIPTSRNARPAASRGGAKETVFLQVYDILEVRRRPGSIRIPESRNEHKARSKGWLLEQYGFDSKSKHRDLALAGAKEGIKEPIE